MKPDIKIGLEIHVELNTLSKLFCSCPTQGSEEPNTRTCEICLGMPGSKPKLNERAIKHVVKLAKALNCKLSKEVLFSRKNYFYPDMSKNYQITQYEIPIGSKGKLDKVGIIRIHLEEDPASLIHPMGIENSKYVLVDYNRSGNPLCEIVTEPDIGSAEEARNFMKKLISLLRYLEIFDPKKHRIKADVNVSIKESGYIRSEIKNITGAREISRAIEYEIPRQKQLVKEKKLNQETRAWNAEKGITSLLRTKESEEDYGYIFDPDLVKIELTNDFMKDIEIPELPLEKENRYVKDLKLSKGDASVITSEYNLTELFEKACEAIDPILAANWIRRELMRVLNYNNIDVSEMEIDNEQFLTLLKLLEQKKITERVAQKILEEMFVNDIDVKEYIRGHDLEVLSDKSEIETYCKEAIKENPKAVDDYKVGKSEALNFLLGQVMGKSHGKAEPKEVIKLLRKNIK